GAAAAVAERLRIDGLAGRHRSRPGHSRRRRQPHFRTVLHALAHGHRARPVHCTRIVRMQSCDAEIRPEFRWPKLLSHSLPGRKCMADLNTTGKANARAPRVLIVDDEPDIRELVAITLERMGVSTLHAGGRREAEAAILGARPDLC